MRDESTEKKSGGMKMDMLRWAENEIDLACKNERAASDRKEGWDYGVACFESAMKAYKSLMEDGHSGFSIGVTKAILNRLIDGKPLTPIEDTPEVWTEINIRGAKEYQCKRMSSLFKTVYSDGTIKYSDNGRVICANIDNPDVTYTCKIARDVVDEMFPITMPYSPRGKSYKVFMEDFLTDPANGDYDTQAILYAIDPDGNRIEINKYFGEVNHRFIEISADKYFERRAKAL
jgi:hypothetical protein